jgi:prephenate dehydratase
MPRSMQSPLAGEQTYAATYQGQPGAFSEDAAFDFVARGSALLPSRTLEDTFDHVSSGQAAFAVVPVENTLAGPIDETYDLLAESGLVIVDETVQPISHCLITSAGTSQESVSRVLSHPIALAQCAGFLAAHTQWEVVRAFDTAGAVEEVLARDIPGEAAIGSARSAEVYGGKILMRDIQDHPENYTRFLLLARDAGSGRDAGRRPRKTSIVLRIPDSDRRRSGVLRPFIDSGIPLTNVLSRPVTDGAASAIYHLDFIGSAGEPEVDRVLGQLKRNATSLKMLGTYPLRVASIREVVRSGLD